jgi:3-deoxy-D-manno-octulosonic-acid transferase
VTVSRAIYTLVHALAMPLILLRLAWRARSNRDYLGCVHQRFGFGVPRAVGPSPVWIHAVSVGEAQAAVPIARALRQRHPDQPLVVTTTTPTGRDRVRQALGDAVTHCYVPYDLPWLVGRFMQTLRPRALIIMETELWPNLFAACTRRAVPIVLANARLSARSARGYRRVAALTREMLSRVACIAAQGQADATRILSLGADPDIVTVTGSIKFDLHLPASLREQAQVLRRQFGTERSVLVAASTHEGEDALVLEAYAHVLRSIPHCLLVLVPRHPERFASAAALCRKRGYSTALRSRAPERIDGVDVFVGDTMGELPLFYAASDVAFVGGSLVPVGGHNMLEPAALGLPVLFGPHVFNFAEISRMLLEVGAAWQVAGARELGEQAMTLLQDANLRHNVGDRGRRFVEVNRGALQRLIQIIEAHLVPAHG